MYTLTKLSKPSLAYINSVTGSGQNRSEVYQFAVAFTLGRALALPVEPVDDLVQYFRLQHELSVLNELDSYNELAPINVKNVMENVLAIYRQRHYAANPPVIPLALRCGCGVPDFFGLSKVFSEATLKMIDCESEALTRHISGLFGVAQDLTIDKVKGRAAWDAIPLENDSYVAP